MTCLYIQNYFSPRLKMLDVLQASFSGSSDVYSHTWKTGDRYLISPHYGCSVQLFER